MAVGMNSGCVEIVLVAVGVEMMAVEVGIVFVGGRDSARGFS